MNPTKIVQFTAENVKRLRAVDITPKGNVVVIAGRNGQGKTSVLDSIMYALAGGNTIPAEPVRRGAEKARVELDLGDIVVRRNFTASGGTALTVTGKDGVKVTSPQTLLDKLTGKLSFDPLEFARAGARQADTLRALVGLDFTEIDQKRQKLYDERTIIGRDAKRMEAQLALTPTILDAPSAEVSTDGILAEQAKAIAQNQANAKVRQIAVDCDKEWDMANARLNSARSRVEALESQLAEAESAFAQCAKDIDSATLALERSAATAKAAVDVDLSSFTQQLTAAAANNRKFQDAMARKTLSDELSGIRKLHDAQNRAIESLDEEKRKLIAGAKYPVDGLGFDQLGGVTFRGLPFAQASTAEQLRVSVAIGLALNPQLRVLLIRDGSLLDDDSMKLVAEMAAKADAQVWIERVEIDGQVSVVIEDGAVKEKV